MYTIYIPTTYTIMLLLLFLIFSRHAGVYVTPSRFVDRTLDVRHTRDDDDDDDARAAYATRPCVRVHIHSESPPPCRPPSPRTFARGFRVATCRRRCLWRQSRGITALATQYYACVPRRLSVSLVLPPPQSSSVTVRLTRRQHTHTSTCRVCVCDKNTRPLRLYTIHILCI